MSSYDPVPVDGIITQEQFKASMKLVRLQIAVPISVLASISANIVCALAIKPGLPGINALYPTLLSPNSTMIGLYWAVLYTLQIGFCLTLLLVRKDVTKETLVNGVGLRFAIANWLMAAWAVCFSLQFFLGAEIVILINVINVLSIHVTLYNYPSTLKRPMDALFIHAPMTLLLAILFQLDWLHNGFIALGWIIEKKKYWSKWLLPAVAGVGGVNVITALWAGFTRQYLLTMSSIYILFSLLFSSPRTTPTLPTTALPKPTAFLVTIIICLVLHPIALLAGVAWRKTKDREGRIRLEEEVQEAEQAQLEAEEGERLRR